MLALFGEGLHPNANALIADQVDAGTPFEDARAEVRLGRRYAHYEQQHDRRPSVEERRRIKENTARAWAQQAALDTAAARVRGTGVSRAEVTEVADALREHRNALARVGGNLNQVAAFANSSGGQLPDAAAGILRVVRELVDESEQMLELSHRVLSPIRGR